MKRLFTALICLTFLYAPASAAQPAQSGKSAGSAKSGGSDRSVKVAPKKDSSRATDGSYYALVIGNNNYKHLLKLKTAHTDARGVEKLLRESYGFETKLLLDATRKDILGGMNEFRKKLREGDSFLIYYAGHGEFDKTADKAYWLPVDAMEDDPTDWIIADDITSNIKRISSKHILIVSDSCYSGTLTRGSTTDLSKSGDREEFLRKMAGRASRTLMASGGNEPVSDGGGGGHSVFASAFLKALGEVERDAFTAEELFHGRIKEIVAGKSEQVPEYNNIRNSGHDGGDFVFLARGMRQDISMPALSEPSKGGFSLDDLEKQGQAVEANKASWKNKLAEMKKAYSQVLAYENKDITPDLKAAAWKRFMEAFPEDDPYSDEDEAMREKARERAGHWDGQVIAMAPRPQKMPAKETPEGMVFVKGGCFEMGDTFGDGDSDEKPVHEVCVDDFYLGKYEVTQKQWVKIMENNDLSYFKRCGECPVESVSWNDISYFIERLNQKTDGKYRLPTEAEWEYAARSGGKKERYSGGGDVDSVAWYDSNAGGNRTHIVGQKRPNGLGIYDMSGNVWEWVHDRYGDSYYVDSPRDNPQGPSGGSDRVLRGNSWDGNVELSRASNRLRANPDNRDSRNGFRLAVSP